MLFRKRKQPENGDYGFVSSLGDEIEDDESFDENDDYGFSNSINDEADAIAADYEWR